MIPDTPVDPLPEVDIPLQVEMADELEMKSSAFDSWGVEAQELDKNGRNIVLRNLYNDSQKG